MAGVVVVPIESESKAAGAGPVLGECIASGKSCKEMICIGFREVLGSKIVNGKGEGGGTECAMAPDTRSVFDRIIDRWGKMG